MIFVIFLAIGFFGFRQLYRWTARMAPKDELIIHMLFDGAFILIGAVFSVFTILFGVIAAVVDYNRYTRRRG
jgi:hypothetical protein